MKKLVLFAVLALVLFSCSSKKEQVETVYELDNLMTMVDQKLNDTITVVGYVTHVCKNAGAHCFIVGESQEISLQVEAKGEIGGFDSELTGSKVEIKGVLKEERMTEESIAEMEKAVQDQLAELAEGETSETCAAKLSNISDMRKWMEEHGKDYYASYYMEGLSYKKVEVDK